MKAVGDYVVLKKIKEAKSKIAGLELTEDQSDDLKFHLGEVVSFGSFVNASTKEESEKIKIGDKVKYDKNAAKFDEINGSEYYVVRAGGIAYIL